MKIQNAETIQSYFTRVSQIKEQLVAAEEEDDKVEGSRTLPKKQINISIQLSFHDIVLLCIFFIFSKCIMHYKMFALMIVYY